jgi:glycosyltransferase involved in cell wall biosynthesis
MLKDRDIICIAAIEWESNWQNAQELTSRLAAAGNRVLYIENTGIRTPKLSEAGRVANKFRKWLRAFGRQGVTEVRPNAYVCSPLVLPPYGSPLRRLLNKRILVPRIRAAVRRLGFRDPIILSYLPTDTAISIAKTLKGKSGVVIYYRIDNFAPLSPRPELIIESERKIIELSDVVFANSEKLAEVPRKLGARVHIFPPAVNLSAFPMVPAGQTKLNGQLEGFRRPLIGCVGGSAQHMDWQMLAEAIRMRPDWSWVFVGPFRSPRADIENAENVHFLGQLGHPELGKVVGKFDVCIIPYLLSEYTSTVVPTKLNEYLALGKPVVSTRLPAILNFNAEHSVLETAAQEPDAFLNSVETALATAGNPDLIAKRRSIASKHEWDDRFAEMTDAIMGEIGRTRR